jgi:hypothetical protein
MGISANSESWKDAGVWANTAHLLYLPLPNRLTMQLLRRSKTNSNKFHSLPRIDQSYAFPADIAKVTILNTANYWRATQTNQNYRYATHTNINYSYATLLIKPLTVTSLMLVMLALTLHNRFNTIILTKSYLFL